MTTHRLAVSAVLLSAIAVLPLSPARAQNAPPCSFPLAWPFCIAGAAINTAAAIATAPLYVVSGGPYYYPQSVYYYPRPHHYHATHWIDPRQ